MPPGFAQPGKVNTRDGARNPLNWRVQHFSNNLPAATETTVHMIDFERSSVVEGDSYRRRNIAGVRRTTNRFKYATAGELRAFLDGRIRNNARLNFEGSGLAAGNLSSFETGAEGDFS